MAKRFNQILILELKFKTFLNCSISHSFVNHLTPVEYVHLELCKALVGKMKKNLY